MVWTASLALLMQLPAFAVQNVLLSWNPRTDIAVAGYKIYYGPASRAYANVMDAGNATSVTITGIEDGTTNYFAATTYDASAHESSYSDEVSFVAKTSSVGADTNTTLVVTNPPGILNTVANVAVATNTADPRSVIVSWDASTDAGVAGYHIFCGTNSGNYFKRIDVGLVTSLVVTDLVAGTTNFYSVRSVDDAWNESPMSPEAVWILPLGENVPPTLNPLANVNLNMNAAAQTVALTGISTGLPGEGQTVKISAVSSNPKLITGLAVKYTNPNSTGTLTFKPVANATGTATITVTAKDSGTGSNTVTQTFTVTVVNQALIAAMPKILRQLTNTATLPGKSVTLGVTVGGKAPFKYQWKHNGTNLPGMTTPILTFKTVKATHAGTYSVLVSNSAGVTNSMTASLTIITNTAPTISTPTRINGQFAFQVTGVPGGRYVVQGSSDLQTWTTLSTNTAPFTFSDADTASFNQRFYRSYYLP